MLAEGLGTSPTSHRGCFLVCTLNRWHPWTGRQAGKPASTTSKQENMFPVRMQQISKCRPTGPHGFPVFTNVRSLAAMLRLPLSRHQVWLRESSPLTLYKNPHGELCTQNSQKASPIRHPQSRVLA